jgi:hypothetical protein
MFLLLYKLNISLVLYGFDAYMAVLLCWMLMLMPTSIQAQLKLHQKGFIALEQVYYKVYLEPMCSYFLDILLQD